MEIQKLVAELDQDAVMEIFLAQEKRLMPSFVRGTYFEHNDNHQELVRLISSDERTLKNLAPIIVEDMAHYFENLALTTKNRKSNSDSKSKYYWEGLGDLSRLLDHPGNMYEKPGAWYIAKDLVFAGTGLYFVDLEGALTHWEASSREKLRVQHYIYLTALLKDFFRVLTHFRIAVAGERDQFRKSRIEKESREMLMGRLNQSGYLELRTTPRSLELTLNYAHLPPEKYRIPQERLPLVTE
jgi:hypothetical protein